VTNGIEYSNSTVSRPPGYCSVCSLQFERVSCWTALSHTLLDLLPTMEENEQQLQEQQQHVEAAFHAAGASAGAAASEAQDPAAASSSAAAASSTVFSAAPNNSAEAADALEMGRTLAEQAGRNGDDDATLARAERLLAKSVRLRATTESMQLLASVQRRRRGAAAAPPAAAAHPVAASSAGAAARPAQPAAAAAPDPSVAAEPAGHAARAPSAPLIAWSRVSVQAPSFFQPPARPGVAALHWTFHYPSILYIPPAQRGPLLLLWGFIFLLALARFTGFSDRGSTAGDSWHDETSRRAHGQYHSRAHTSHYSESERSYGGSREQLRGEEPADDWNRESYVPYRSGSGFISINTLNNLLSLLPFLFFFILPMIQRHRQQQQHGR
jgi:hypothetical protein